MTCIYQSTSATFGWTWNLPIDTTGSTTATTEWVDFDAYSWVSTVTPSINRALRWFDRFRTEDAVEPIRNLAPATARLARILQFTAQAIRRRQKRRAWLQKLSTGSAS